MKRKTLTILLILTICFIWSNSILNREYSGEESNWVLHIFDLLFGKGVFSGQFVRKLAHFTEFCALGMELYGLMRRYPLAVTHALFVALSDETIQYFSGRFPSVADVWLDWAGALFGALIVLLIKKRQSGKEPAEVQE